MSSRSSPFTSTSSNATAAFSRLSPTTEVTQTRQMVVVRPTPSPPRIPPPKPPPSSNNNVVIPSPTTGIVKKTAGLFMRPATVYALSPPPNSAANTSPVKIPSSTPPPAPVAPKSRTTYSLKDFELGITLGTGSFGRVRFARWREPVTPDEANQRLAIKMLKKKEVIRLNQVEHIINEKSILFMLSSPGTTTGTTTTKPTRHPFVVRMYGTFMDEHYLYMALEFVRGGEFFTHLRNRGHLKNHEAQFYAASVASVFSYLHSFDIVYRDLKPENLLLDHHGYVKVTDFGFAKHIPDDKTFTLCGTPEYLAPEILLNQGHGKGVDWWALGVLVYEMLSGGAPFVHEDTMEVYQLIVRAQVIYPSYFDPDARSFLRRLLQPDVSKRFGCLVDGARDVMHHRWLGGIDYEALMKKSRPPIPPIEIDTKGIDDTSNFERYDDNEGGGGGDGSIGVNTNHSDSSKVTFDGFPGVVAVVG